MPSSEILEDVFNIYYADIFMDLYYSIEEHCKDYAYNILDNSSYNTCSEFLNLIINNVDLTDMYYIVKKKNKNAIKN